MASFAPLPRSSSSSSRVAINDDDDTSSNYPISVPDKDFDATIERGIYVFSAVATGFLTEQLQKTGGHASVLILLVLLMAAFVFFQFQSLVEKVVKHHLPVEFEQVGLSVVKVCGFISLTSVYVTCSYAIVIVMSLCMYGNLSVSETAAIVIGGVMVIQQFSVSYGSLRVLLVRTKRLQSKSQQNRGQK